MILYTLNISFCNPYDPFLSSPFMKLFPTMLNLLSSASQIIRYFQNQQPKYFLNIKYNDRDMQKIKLSHLLALFPHKKPLSIADIWSTKIL